MIAEMWLETIVLLELVIVLIAVIAYTKSYSSYRNHFTIDLIAIFSWFISISSIAMLALDIFRSLRMKASAEGKSDFTGDALKRFWYFFFVSSILLN